MGTIFSDQNNYESALGWREISLIISYTGGLVNFETEIFAEDDFDPGESQMNSASHGVAEIDARSYLDALIKHQSGEQKTELKLPLHNLKHDSPASLIFVSNAIIFNHGDRYSPDHASINLEPVASNFLFLDSLSVIEDHYDSKKNPRDIELSTVESFFVELTKANPELMHSYSPRLFEYFVAATLTELGFSNVKMSRYWQDYGRDILATYFEGDTRHTVVVEVKHYTKRKVGVEIVDRLNGVRDRDGATRGMVITNSSFTAPAQNSYTACRDRIALVDYEKLRELLENSCDWLCTPSGLWTPSHQSQSGGLAVVGDVNHDARNAISPKVVGDVKDDGPNTVSCRIKEVFVKVLKRSRWKR